MTKFNTNSPSLNFEHVINTLSFFEEIKTGTTLFNISIIENVSNLIQALEQSEWIVNPNINDEVLQKQIKSTMLVMNDTLDNAFTSDIVSTNISMLKLYYTDLTKPKYIPDLINIDKRVVDILSKNDYVISKKVKQKIIKILHLSIRERTDYFEARFNKELRDTFNQYITGTWEFTVHQKYTFLWFLDNVINNSNVDMNAIKINDYLISHKTRSGKSEVFAGLTLLFSLYNKRPVYNAIFASFFPDVFDSIKESFDKYSIVNTIDLRKTVNLDTDMNTKGINIVMTSLQWLYGEENVEEKEEDIICKVTNNKQAFVSAQKITWDMFCIDEAHNASCAQRTLEETDKINCHIAINTTATPNKERLAEMAKQGNVCEFKYREEQILKKLKYNRYNMAPERIMFDLNDTALKYNGVTYNDHINSKGYESFSELVYHYDKSNKNKRQPDGTYNLIKNSLHHNDMNLINNGIKAMINSIINTQYNGTTNGYGIVGNINRVLHAERPILNKRFQKLLKKGKTFLGYTSDKLTAADISDCYDTIMVLQNIETLDKFYNILLADKTINQLFDVVRVHSQLKSGDKLSTRQLEKMTSEHDIKPRIILLCGCGLQGSTFKTVNTVIHLHTIKADAKYIQTIERGGSYVDGKFDYFVMDFDPKKLTKCYGIVQPDRPDTHADYSKDEFEFKDSSTVLHNGDIDQSPDKGFDTIVEQHRLNIAEETRKNRKEEFPNKTKREVFADFNG